MFDDYPFPASHHKIIFQPAPPGKEPIQGTLGDIMTGKVILNAGQLEFCECGIIFEMPETVREMAVRLARTLPLETPMVYGLCHIYKECLVGIPEEEIIARLEEWRNKKESIDRLPPYKKE